MHAQVDEILEAAKRIELILIDQFGAKAGKGLGDLTNQMEDRLPKSLARTIRRFNRERNARFHAKGKPRLEPKELLILSEEILHDLNLFASLRGGMQLTSEESLKLNKNRENLIPTPEPVPAPKGKIHHVDVEIGPQGIILKVQAYLKQQEGLHWRVRAWLMRIRPHNKKKEFITGRIESHTNPDGYLLASAHIGPDVTRTSDFFPAVSIQFPKNVLDASLGSGRHRILARVDLANTQVHFQPYAKEAYFTDQFNWHRFPFPVKARKWYGGNPGWENGIAIGLSDAGYSVKCDRGWVRERLIKEEDIAWKE